MRSSPSLVEKHLRSASGIWLKNDSKSVSCDPVIIRIEGVEIGIGVAVGGTSVGSTSTLPHAMNTKATKAKIGIENE